MAANSRCAAVGALAVPWANCLTALGASGHIENLPYTSYTFTGKLDLRDVHLPDVYLPDVHPRRRIPCRHASYIYRRARRTEACTLRAYISRACIPRVCISRVCTSRACISWACIFRAYMSWGYTS